MEAEEAEGANIRNVSSDYEYDDAVEEERAIDSDEIQEEIEEEMNQQAYDEEDLSQEVEEESEETSEEE